MEDSVVDIDQEDLDLVDLDPDPTDRILFTDPCSGDSDHMATVTVMVAVVLAECLEY